MAVSLQELADKVDDLRNDLSEAITRFRMSWQQIILASGLSELSENLGLIRAGEFRTGTSDEPGKGFTGVRIGYPGFTYDSETWHIVGVNSDTFQVGIRATDGVLVAGAGVVTLDDTGIQIVSETGSSPTDQSSIQFTTSGTTVNTIESYANGLTFNIYNKTTPAAGMDIGCWGNGGRTLWNLGSDDTNDLYAAYFRMGNNYALEWLYNTASSTGWMLFNYAALDIDFIVKDDAGNAAIDVDAGTGLVDVSLSGWAQIGVTWTRTGNNTFTVSGDVTGNYDYHPGTKVKVTDSGGVKYGVIEQTSYSSPNTTVTLIDNDDYDLASGTLSSPYVSHIEMPDGWPDWFNYTPSITGQSSMTISGVTVNYAKWRVSGHTVHVVVRAVGTVGGTGATFFYIDLPVDFATSNFGTCAAGVADGGSQVTGLGVFTGSTTPDSIGVAQYNRANFTPGNACILAFQCFYNFTT